MKKLSALLLLVAVVLLVPACHRRCCEKSCCEPKVCKERCVRPCEKKCEQKCHKRHECSCKTHQTKEEPVETKEIKE